MTYKSFHHTLPSHLELVPESASQPLPFFAPTTVKLARHGDQVTWNTRDHRKQRHRVASPRRGHRRHVTGTWARIARMGNQEYWNISWWVAVLFTLGSVIWVINGFIVFLPFVTPVSKDQVGGGWSAWIGATIFEAGSLLLILEAWNRDDAAYFGQALEQALGGRYGEKEAKHDDSAPDSAADASKPRWIWWSTDPKYWHELGFAAGFAQLLGATIFWIKHRFTGIPEIQDMLQEHPAALAGIYWTPQVVGGTGFIVSSTLYMLETQKKWYIPALKSLGWHIGFWNFIGAIGFTLCGALGYSTKSGPMYQSSLSTFWGGWAFLIGSVIQWYEAVNPVREAAP